MKDKKIYLIVNPTSGGGKGAAVGRALCNSLTKQAIPFQQRVSRYAGETKVLVNQYCKKYQNDNERPILVIVGGDGTINETIQAMGEGYRHIPIAYIAAGSGNDFARGSGLPRSPQKALAHILNLAAPQSLDIVHYHSLKDKQKGYFVNNFGLGFDALIVRIANQSRLKKSLNKLGLGTFTYVIALLKGYFKQAAFDLKIEMNEQTIDFPQAFLVTTTIHPYFGGGVALAPMAQNTDAKMDLVVVRKVSLFKLIQLFCGMLVGGHHVKSIEFHHYQSAKLKLIINEQVDGQIDGEVLGKAPYEVTFETQQQFFWI